MVLSFVHSALNHTSAYMVFCLQTCWSTNARFFGWLLPLLLLCQVHVIWKGRRIWKLVLNVKYFLLLPFFNCSHILQFGAHSKYYKGALTQERSLLVLCTTVRSDFHVGWKSQNKHSTLDLLFDVPLKWHDPRIKEARC